MKTGVSVVLLLALIVAADAVRLVATGAATTMTTVPGLVLAESWAALVTVRVKL